MLYEAILASKDQNLDMRFPLNKNCLYSALAAVMIVFLAFSTPGAETKPSVAVLDFESMGTEDYLGKAVAEIMRTALVSNTQYRVVERAQINKAISEQKFQKSGIIDDKSAVEIGKVLGADLIIVGSVVRIGNAYTINSRMIDVKTGEAKLGKNVTGTNLNLITAMSNELVENLFGREEKQTLKNNDGGEKAIGQRMMQGRHDSGYYVDLDNWEILDGQWYAENGAIVGSGGHLILKDEFRDYIFEVRVEHLSGPKSGVGIGTRCTVVPGGQKTFRNHTSINQGYAFNFDFKGSYNIYSGLSGNWHPMNPNWRRYDWQHSGLFRKDINNIRMETKGKNIKIFVNDSLLVEYSDSSHSRGAPLLWVQDPAERIRFSDVKVLILR